MFITGQGQAFTGRYPIGTTPAGSGVSEAIIYQTKTIPKRRWAIDEEIIKIDAKIVKTKHEA